MKFIQCKDHSIQYEWQDNNQKESLLFINALGSNLRIWDELATNLSSEFNILRFNKRGHGFSSIKSNPTYMSDYASDVLCLLDTLQIPIINVVGLSIGGMIAMALNAAQVPKALYREIEGVGHMPCIDKPDLMSSLIREFIQKT